MKSTLYTSIYLICVILTPWVPRNARSVIDFYPWIPTIKQYLLFLFKSGQSKPQKFAITSTAYLAYLKVIHSWLFIMVVSREYLLHNLSWLKVLITFKSLTTIYQNNVAWDKDLKEFCSITHTVLSNITRKQYTGDILQLKLFIY